ncbi:MAG: hypothetical protein UR66_C0023G0004 [Candidatus Moranbacteria bacterium GW2011_GWE1_35_17]|nr:MAG: hypothetical protein UR66_C0023G0004 [Candidatus Moranbacteria bacterium GW2011_GWE1_35_17]
MNKKISTIAGSLIIVAIAAALGFSFLSTNKKEEMQNKNNVILNNSGLGNKEEVNKSDENINSENKKSISPEEEKTYEVNPETPVCDEKSNLISWDESRNGYYYLKGNDYFTFSYPCNYNIHFSDMGSFYYLNKSNNINERIVVTRSKYENERINIVKKIYSKSQSQILDKKLNIDYDYKVYSIQIDKNAEQKCGECLEYAGYTYNGVEIKANNNPYYYYFQADSVIDKEELFKVAESFTYNIIEKK